MCSEASAPNTAIRLSEPFVMSGSCHARDASPAVILGMSCTDWLSTKPFDRASQPSTLR
jgi:hypothetical protein